MHANSGATRDCRLYDICDPWYGERGAPFVRKFKPSFVNGLGNKRDKVATLRQHLKGSDPGSRSPVTAAQLAANPNHVNAVNNHGNNAGARATAPKL